MSIASAVRAMATDLARSHAPELLAVIQPGQLGCCKCGHLGPAESFAYGRGRRFGQHPEHRYCPSCGLSIDWYGHVTYAMREYVESQHGVTAVATTN